MALTILTMKTWAAGQASFVLAVVTKYYVYFDRPVPCFHLLTSLI